MRSFLRIATFATALAATVLTSASPVCAQQGAPAPALPDSLRDARDASVPPDLPDFPEPVSAIGGRDELQDLYRELYEVQIQLSRRERSQARVDSLEQVRDDLLARIEEVAARVERQRASRRPGLPPRTPAGDDVSVLVGELERLGSEVDWEEISRHFERNAQSVGEGLAVIGEQLRDLEIQLDEDRVRVDTGSGSRFTFKIPPELKADISQGIREMGVELDRVLGDSTRQALGGEFRGLLEELPEDFVSRLGIRDRRPARKKVIAESVFQLWKDFEIAEDEVVRGDVLLIGGDAYVAGEVQGNVYVVFGDLFVEGRGDVAEDAISLGGRVRVDDDAEVHGRRFDVGAVVPGFGISSWSGSGSAPWVLHGVRVAVLAVLLVLAFALAGRRLEVMVAEGQTTVGRHLVSGVLWFSIVLGVFVVAAVGLAISVIGIPVVIVLACAFVLVVLLAYFVGCQVVGERVLDVVGGRQPAREWQVALVGLGLLEVPALVAVALSTSGLAGDAIVLLWGLAYFVKLLALGIGFGAAVATRLGGPTNGTARAEAESAPLASEL